MVLFSGGLRKMSLNLLLAFCFLINVDLGSASAHGYCYNTYDNPYRWYSTSTKYQTVWDTKTESHLNTSHMEGCEPSTFYLLARHGSRYPRGDDISKMIELLPKFQDAIPDSSLCAEDKEALESWIMRMRESDAYDMVEEGWRELRGMAERFSKSFRDLLDIAYDEKWFQFQHTETERARDSALAFAEGLFGSYDGVAFEQIPASSDWLLRFNMLCAKYAATKEGNSVIYKAFKQGPEIRGVIETVQHRTGLLMDSEMDEEEKLEGLAILYETCTFEYQIYGDSPWCAVFTEEDLKVLEYEKDLLYYWREGYGHQITYEQSCNLLKDIVYYLGLDEKLPSPTHKVLTRFAHHPTLNALYAKLGLFKDSMALTANGYKDHANRQWRTSHFMPMSANIAFVRYDCSPNEEDKVAVYVNEELITLPVSGCTNGICPVSALSNEWLPTTRTCDVEEICDVTNVNTAAKATAPFAALMMSLVATIYIAM